MKPIKKDYFAMTDFVVPGLDVHLAMTRFRLASRELFNNYFHTGNRDERGGRGNSDSRLGRHSAS
jgi:hypothetical protein